MLGKIWFFCLVSFIFAKPALATPPVILSFPQDIKVDSEFTITATMSGLTKNSVYRLRIALSKPDTHSYFGSTEGYNGTPSPIDYSKFKSMTTDNFGSWNGEIKGKVENSDPNYKDKELKTFELKLGRYTETGTSATWSEPKTINLENPNPPTPTPAPTPKKAESAVQKTQTPIFSSTPIPLVSPISQIEEAPKEDENFEFENILATSTSEIIENPRPSEFPVQRSESKTKYFFFIAAFFFLLLSALAFLKKKADIIKK